MGAATTTTEADDGKQRDEAATLAQLLARVARRDSAALRELYLAYARRVHAYAMQVLRDEHAAEDVVQDVFIRVWRYAASYDGAKAQRPEAWLFQIARNVALDEAVQRARLVHEDAHAEAMDAQAVMPAYEDRADTRGEAFGRALEGLPSHCRQVLHLRFHEGLSNPEIARHLGVPVGTAKTWLRRGLLQMRASMNVAVPAGARQEEWT